MTRVVALVQARMTSTRLPGKTFLDVVGKPMLARVLERLDRCRTLDEVVVATTVEPEEEPIVRWCVAEGRRFTRGSRDDVLDRYYQAAHERSAEVVVRITSDCPLIDPEEVDAVVETLLARHDEVEYVSNTFPRRTFPRGLDAEAFSFAALERAWREDLDPASREHVTPLLYRRSDLFRIGSVVGPTDESAHRWTVDTPDDLELVRRIYGELGDAPFGWRRVLRLLTDRPEWIELNRHVPKVALSR